MFFLKYFPLKNNGKEYTEYMLVWQKIRGGFCLNFEVMLIGHMWFGVMQSPKMHAEKKKCHHQDNIFLYVNLQ